jgi:hypothetical protein
MRPSGMFWSGEVEIGVGRYEIIPIVTSHVSTN